MTQSLTERLQERLSEETATIETILASELQKLGTSLRTELDVAFASMGSAMAASAASTTAQVTRDLGRVRRLGPWWWGTMAVSWATTMALLGSLLWLWMSPPSTAALLSGVGVDPVFEAEGRTYLLLPQGSQALRCRQGRGQWVPCVALPTQASTAPSLERTLEREQAEQASADGGSASGMPASGSVAGGSAQGAAPSEGGRLLWPPAARPQTRPEGQPAAQTGTQPGQEG